MVGSGRTEIIRGIVGATRRHGGELSLHGKKLANRNPRESIRAGIAYITEDRQKLGLMLNVSILENMLVVALDKLVRSAFLLPKRQFGLIKDVYEQLSIKARSHMMPVKHLSGGNQQKVVLGKWLVNDADVFIFDEPTRGIDVSAKADFYKIMSRLVGLGKSIIMISSDMPELISMSDRVLVIKKERIVCELSQGEITEQNVIKYALNV
jgi:ABC-type sugar transport system ATPase subunit